MTSAHSFHPKVASVPTGSQDPWWGAQSGSSLLLHTTQEGRPICVISYLPVLITPSGPQSKRAPGDRKSEIDHPLPPSLGLIYLSDSLCHEYQDLQDRDMKRKLDIGEICWGWKGNSKGALLLFSC